MTTEMMLIHWKVKTDILFGCSVIAFICQVINYTIDPNHQYWWKTSDVDQFQCFGFDLMDTIWFPAIKVFSIILGIMEVFLSQSFQKFPSEDINNLMNELMHPIKQKVMHTISGILSEIRVGYCKKSLWKAFFSFTSCPCCVGFNNLQIKCRYLKLV